MSVPEPVKGVLTSATLPSGATHTIRRSLTASVTPAQAVWPKFHSLFGVKQSFDWKVAMLSANAATELLGGNSEAERVMATSKTLRAMPTESGLNRGSLLEMVLAFECFLDEKIDFVILLRESRIPVELSRHFIVVPPC